MVLNYENADCSLKQYIYCVIYYNFRHTFVRYRPTIHGSNTAPQRCSEVACSLAARLSVLLQRFNAALLRDRSVDEAAGHSSQFCSGITSNFPSRAFSVSAPSTWNSLPAHIRSIDTLSTFKRHHLNSDCVT